MTKKDYELIAHVIRIEVEHYEIESKKPSASDEYREMSRESLNTLALLTVNFNTLLLEKNPRFDGKKFTEACGFVKIKR